MASFRAAYDAGAAMVELDVRRAADGVLVVIHDRRLDRTTNHRGSVYRTAYTDFCGADAGIWFGSRFAGEHVPSLDQVLSTLPPGLAVDIEVKTDGDSRWRTQTIPAVAEAVRAHRASRDLLVSSFNHTFLRLLHRLDPTIRTGALAMPVRDATRLPSSLARRLAISCYVCSRPALRRRAVSNAHAHGISVFVYGVNTARHLVRVLRYGVDGIITDHPALMRRLLEKRTPR